MLPSPPYFDESVWGQKTWPLLSAAIEGDLRTALGILDKEPGAIRCQFAYYEPLHYAVRGGSVAMVEALLKRGANPKAAGWTRLGDETPISKAMDREREDVTVLLEQSAQRFHEPLPPPEEVRTPEQQLEFDLEIACGRNDGPRIEEILHTRPDLATAGLYEAIHHGHKELALFLIRAGANINGQMPWACWFTPLMHAVRHAPAWGLAEMLLEHGYVINSTNGLGMTALHIAAFGNDLAAIRWLLDHGASIDAIDDEFNSTPVGWAARWGRLEAAALLLDRGADSSLPQDQPWARPTRWAEKKGHRDVAALFNQRVTSQESRAGN